MTRLRSTLVRVLSALAVALILLSVVYRFLWLNNTPALNADEPYPIVQLMNALAGRPHHVRSPHGQFFDPVMMTTELLTLLPRYPSIFLLRLPAAITGVITLACFAVFSRRLFSSHRQILFATLLLAAMPLSIATSRIQWDTSYIPLFECFVVFPMLDLAAGMHSRRSLLLITGFTILGLWTHATFALLIVCLSIAVLFVQRHRILSAIASRLHINPSPLLAFALAAAPFISATLVFVVLTRVVSTGVGLTGIANNSMRQIIYDSTQTASSFLASPGRLANYIGRIGDAVTGVSTYEDIAGLPISRALHALSWFTVAMLVAGTIRLAPSPHPGDRSLAVFWLIVPMVLIATAYPLRLDQVGVERYTVWLLVPVAVTLTRFAAILFESRGQRQSDLSCALIVLPLSAIMLYTFVPDYFTPIRHLTYRQNTYPAYWSADTDPKFTAADWIRQHAPHTTVHAENWWIDYPLQYDLGLEWTVTEDALPDPLPAGPIVIVCFCNSGTYADIEQNYLDHIQSRLTTVGRHFDTHVIDAADGKPAVAVIIVLQL